MRKKDNTYLLEYKRKKKKEKGQIIIFHGNNEWNTAWHQRAFELSEAYANVWDQISSIVVQKSTVAIETRKRRVIGYRRDKSNGFSIKPWRKRKH